MCMFEEENGNDVETLQSRISVGAQGHVSDITGTTNESINLFANNALAFVSTSDPVSLNTRL